RRQRISRARPARNLCRYGADDAPETGNPEGVSAVSSRTMTRPSPSSALSGWCFGPISGHIGPEDPLNQANAGLSPSMSCRAKSGRLRRVDKVLLGPGLARDTLHQHVQPRVANPARVQPGVPHELVNLTGRTLTATLTVDEHVEVHHRSDRARPVRLLVLVDREHSRAGRHRRPHTGQNVAARSVAPIVKNPLHDVHVGAHLELAE